MIDENNIDEGHKKYYNQREGNRIEREKGIVKRYCV